jgi:hypothetical protein
MMVTVQFRIPLPDSSKKYDALEVAPEISTSVFNLIRFYTRFLIVLSLLNIKVCQMMVLTALEGKRG